MIDRRLIGNLRYLSAHFAIYINEGYAGPLPGHPRQTVGCPRCHVADSDHKNGLAVDIGPRHWSASCDRHWKGVTRLARWAEPRQNRPRAPFRWVGYNGDANHGCGNHLHLSWSHAEVARYRIAPWVEVFRGAGRPGGGGTGGRGAERGHQRRPHPSDAEAGDRRDRPRRLRPPADRAAAAGRLRLSSIGPWRPGSCGGPDRGRLAARSRLRLGGGEDPGGLSRPAPAPTRAPFAALPPRPGSPGGIPISSCLTENQSAGDLTRVGAAMVAVATSLNARARAGRRARRGAAAGLPDRRRPPRGRGHRGDPRQPGLEAGGGGRVQPRRGRPSTGARRRLQGGDRGGRRARIGSPARITSAPERQPTEGAN